MHWLCTPHSIFLTGSTCTHVADDWHKCISDCFCRVGIIWLNSNGHIPAIILCQISMINHRYYKTIFQGFIPLLLPFSFTQDMTGVCVKFNSVLTEFLQLVVCRCSWQRTLLRTEGGELHEWRGPSLELAFVESDAARERELIKWRPRPHLLAGKEYYRPTRRIWKRSPRILSMRSLCFC